MSPAAILNVISVHGPGGVLHLVNQNVTIKKDVFTLITFRIAAGSNMPGSTGNKQAHREPLVQLFNWSPSPANKCFSMTNKCSLTELLTHTLVTLCYI